ncbi:NAD(P)-binding domain-containing protein [Candidatus Acetothermia bacterium]|nr:NAD(P)-binding domain-containing protein [Candidatus Acetothermia bacterium]
MQTKELLIIGAGPYGLATAAYAQHQGLDFSLIGKPMDFWHRHMPQGMFLRSGTDWHIDPLEVHTLEAYLQKKKISKEQAHPVPIQLVCDYVEWFQEQYDLKAQPSLIRELRKSNGLFEAVSENGESIRARNVLLALGFSSFVNIPQDLQNKIPSGHSSHTCDAVDFDFLKERRCLIIGGRQSAYEWAALIHERGANEIHIVHRHPTPQFALSDWAWVSEMVRATAQVPGWFRRKSKEEQEAIRQRFWAEGRLKLEPWLGPRINKPSIYVWPNSNVIECAELNGSLHVKLDNGKVFEVDHIILATGYRVDVNKVPFLSKESILPNLKTVEGFPVLDESFQSSISGLFFSGLSATKDFGPFFGFVVGCPVAGKMVVDRIKSSQ